MPAFRQNGSHIVTVGCRDPQRGTAFAQRLDIAEAQTYEAAVTRPDIDAVYIGLHNGGHLPWTLAALAAGKHVLCEKPLALNAGEVRQMQAAQRASGKLVCEAFMYRFHPQAERLRSLVAGGAIGTPRLLRGSFGALMVAHFEGAMRGEHPLRWGVDDALQQALLIDALLAMR